MRKVVIIAIILVIVLSLGVFYVFMRYGDYKNISLSTNPCKTVQYKIGQVDSEFQLNKQEFRNITESAVKEWESKINVDLFQYDPQANFSINLQYNEENTNFTGSIDTTTNSDSNSKIEQWKRRRDKLNKNYEMITKKLKNLKEEYNNRTRKYNQQLEKLEQQQEFDQQKYQQLQQEKKKLDQIKQSINTQKQKAKKIANKIKSLQKQITKKQQQSKENGRVTFKQKYGNTENFREKNIDKNIVFNNYRDFNSLKLKLMHHLGHKLGVEHATENRKSIMYPEQGSQLLSNLTLTQEDVELLTNSCSSKFKLNIFDLI